LQSAWPCKRAKGYGRRVNLKLPRWVRLKVLVTTLGNSRMGTDPAQAVVDPDGRSFDVPNLYICDNSVFPSALAANPALTQMALALRTAERFLAR
ncbi:GMC family oxidoreductase, partial [Xanthomonas phaseoli]|uniref:GMC family oxidoreductase n=2 Tax=Xanthomonas phaseoli TaxID=1985254 RepID=UPI001EE670C1